MMDPLVPVKEEIAKPKDVEIMELLPVETPVTSTSSQIHRAAKDGRLNVLKACLEANPRSLNMLDDKEMAPLHYAAQCNRREIIDYLVEAGADVNIRGAGNITPLHIAARLVICSIIKVKKRLFRCMCSCCFVMNLLTPRLFLSTYMFHAENLCNNVDFRYNF